MKFALKASGEKKIKNMKCKFTTFAKMTSGLKLQWTKKTNQFEVHGSNEVTKNEIQSTKLDPLKWERQFGF